MIWALLLIPTLAGLAAFAVRPNRPRRLIVLVAAACHAGLVVAAWRHLPSPTLGGWLALDAASLLLLSITSLLFLAAAVYAVGYLAAEHRQGRHRVDDVEMPFVNFPEAAFAGCLLLFLATMTLVAVSRHVGLLWVGVEATTLASAPLIYFHRQQRSLEATWKYLMICSVGIALALLGNFFLAVATRSFGGMTIHMTIDDLLAHATRLDPRWLKAAFLLFLVGYGTKMGLAPMHTWLPDAHSEAPSLVSALLSGALLNCAFFTILRGFSILAAAGLGDFGREMLLLFGLLSMSVAALFIIGQTDFKRMLAYSSVEHMGILSLGIGIGGLAGVGAMLHTVNHSLAKALLFFTAGNILAVYRTKSAREVGGVLKLLPVSGILWVGGFLAIAGSPPFGPFLSELVILKGVFDAGRPVVAIVYLLALAIVFIGMAGIVIRMAYAPPAVHVGTSAFDAEEPVGLLPRRESLWTVAPPIGLGLAVIVLGVYLPPELTSLINQAAVVLGVK